MRNKIDKLLAAGFVSTLIIAALAQGTVEPWSQLIFLLMLVLMFMIWLIKEFISEYFNFNVPVLIWPLLVLTLYAYLQSLVWIDQAGNRHSLSIDVEATRGVALLSTGLVMACLLCANIFNSQMRIGHLIKVLTFYGFFLATVALVQHFAPTELAYWPRPIQNNSFGPFINRDHFAGYMELLLPLPCALLVTRSITGQRRLVYGVMAAVMGMALIFTLSRGGMISLVVELIMIASFNFHYFLKQPRKSERKKPATSKHWMGMTTVAIILVTIFAGVLWIGAEPVVERITQTIEDPDGQQNFYQIRGGIWQDSWRIFRANPWWGTGLGSFETAFPLYATDDGSNGLTAQAHNDYLQILTDAGLFGGAMAACFLLGFLNEFFKSLRHSDPELAGLALGCGVGAIGLLIHSFFDFNFQLPSHSILFLCLTTIVTCLARTRQTVVPKANPVPVITNALVEGVSL